MKRNLRFTALAGATLLLAGCTKITYDATTLRGFAAANDPRAAAEAEFEVVGQLQHSTYALFAAASLVTVRDANLEKAAEKAMAKYGGDGVVNIRILEETDGISFLIGVFGGAIVSARHVVVQGDVVKYKPGRTAP